ncbi:lipase 3 [Lasius niger]|uniref:Lipase 3 n=1 Tax=Lasius niger TaxID=67767 RepID=A0A0J7K0Z0_LASNI|nr:lipase 3 [Lasius niger]
MIMRFFFHDELLPQSDLLRFGIEYVCNQNLDTQKFCADIIFMICGFDREQFNYTLLPVILNHDPAGASTKTVLHYNQVYQSDKFRQYDYGLLKNLLMYHSPEPPNYDLANITVPIALFYGSNDWIVNTVNVKRLNRILPNVVDIYEVPWSNFNHVDFVWAKDAPKLVYERVLRIMREKNLNNAISTE